MRRPPSLTLRLTVLFAFAAATIFLVFGWFISRSIEHHFEEGDIAELRIIARTVEQGLSGVRTAADLTSLERRFEDILMSHHRASLYILGEDKQLIYTSPETDLAAFAQTLNGDAGGDSVNRWSDGQHNYRVLTRRVGEHGFAASTPYTMIIAVQIDFHLQFLEQFRRTLWLMIAGSIAIMTVMGWVVVRQGHAPLHDI
ncbi:MAG TPA: hypothetical protein VET88_13770, partial [Gammaproteobacteria bacterium]|nr:hypothetical protein [Gammaproteobacteria bacterium]